MIDEIIRLQYRHREWAMAKLFDAAARARIVRTFARGLGTPAAYVLPLRRDGAAWASEAWQTRRHPSSRAKA